MRNTVLLEELIQIQSGKSRPKLKGIFPVYGGNGIFDTAPNPNISKPAVIVGRVGAYCGSVYIERNPFWLSDNALGITARSDADLLFLYYLLKSIDLNKKSVGGAQPLLTQGIINKIQVTVPQLSQQEIIAGILGTIDEKIELNRKTNETLAQIAQTMFRKYFIANNESDIWKTVKLKNVVEKINHSLKPGDTLAGRIYLPIDRLSMDSLSILDPLDYLEAKSSLIGFDKNDILVGAMRVYFHRVNIAPAEGVTRTTTFVLRPKSDILRSYSVLVLNEASTISYANTHSKGTTMPYAIWNNGLAEMPIKAPPSALLEEFQRLSWPILEVIRDSYKNTQTLTTLRDSLLPKLMSGKIEV